jgi:DMSO reductase family type II enzyme heme b subunit
MRVRRVAAADEALLDGAGAAWALPAEQRIALIPAPVTLAAAVSPQMALRQTHGRVHALSARALHNGEMLSVRLAWEDPAEDDEIRDLDQFADAAAIMFPLLADANPFTMGDEQQPVNAWLWRADRPEPFDVIARGYSTSQRRAASESGLVARGGHRGGKWVVVFQRPLLPGNGEFARFEPGTTAKIAFAVWDGSNAERAGQKAVSGVFIDLALDG